MRLSAGRAAALGAHRSAGVATAGQWLADVTKESAGAVASALRTAAELSDERTAATRRALVDGRLAATQASELASVAVGRPEEQERLLALAARETTGKSRAECRRLRLAGQPGEDPAARRRRQAAEMRFRHCDLGDGMSELVARLPTTWLELVLAAVRAQCDAVFDRARAGGRDDLHACRSRHDRKSAENWQLSAAPGGAASSHRTIATTRATHRRPPWRP